MLGRQAGASQLDSLTERCTRARVNGKLDALRNVGFSASGIDRFQPGRSGVLGSERFHRRICLQKIGRVPGHATRAQQRVPAYGRPGGCNSCAAS